MSSRTRGSIRLKIFFGALGEGFFSASGDGEISSGQPGVLDAGGIVSSGGASASPRFGGDAISVVSSFQRDGTASPSASLAEISSGRASEVRSVEGALS